MFLLAKVRYVYISSEIPKQLIAFIIDFMLVMILINIVSSVIIIKTPSLGLRIYRKIRHVIYFEQLFILTNTS